MDLVSPSTKPIAILVSGGIDSTTLLFDYLNKGIDVLPIIIDYAQRHSRELQSATRVLEVAHAMHGEWGSGGHVMEPVRLDLSSVGRSLLGSSQTNTDVAVPLGGETKAACVPNRNMLMVAAAASIALDTGIHRVAYGALAGAVYPDCQPAFVDALAAVLRLCDYEPVELLTPYITMTKAQVISLGIKLRVPYELTWSCYAGREKPCGKCGACRVRLAAFDGLDPVEYES